jgi:hypothetical protein
MIRIPQAAPCGTLSAILNFMCLDRVFRPTYFVVSDGKRYKTTHQVFAPLTIGEQVRAELGAGSRAILRAQPAVEQPMPRHKGTSKLPATQRTDPTHRLHRPSKRADGRNSVTGSGPWAHRFRAKTAHGDVLLFLNRVAIGGPTDISPRFRTIQVCPKDLASTLRQAG